MLIIKKSYELIQVLNKFKLKNSNLQISFIPTMGNLHAGHLELIKYGLLKSHCLIVSIFVNPIQFSESEDFKKYPKNLKQDIKKLIAYQVDILFCPTLKSMYPYGCKNHTYIDVPQYSSILEGEKRPKHFLGVATIIAKLFNLIRPQIAIFGQKDFQQLIMVRQLILHMNYNIKIISVPTIREFDGLALSSRNQYLSIRERKIAPNLYQILFQLSKKIKSNTIDIIINNEKSFLHEASSKLIACGFKIDLLKIRNAKNLMKLNNNNKHIIILCSAWIGKTRLIDNIKFKLF
ncbi:pantothenate synthetase [Wigglesworthia glossinidia endosymbiont of Glossina morsitans morsitans (Yale colony)]|uniref:Pantothenate synthetase n=1 Tax=Wigglesworthia glossinidia endosymbiont of Glossina morsitans morsitans (Yale colony) TaxID=1142511 RepID=H6Q5V3_WIGGL|nr:pantoate--beta-alanine ligase [Wigglesworthia glossinidia]AFA41149.1 pantothenate synthetase [Wigglesworthia glossinidia endosymbiont of Glossina morsitans morsitans (Yale colony)]